MTATTSENRRAVPARSVGAARRAPGFFWKGSLGWEVAATGRFVPVCPKPADRMAAFGRKKGDRAGASDSMSLKC